MSAPSVNFSRLRLEKWNHLCPSAINLILDAGPLDFALDSSSSIIPDCIEAESSEANSINDFNSIVTGLTQNDCGSAAKFPIDLMANYVPEEPVVGWNLVDPIIVDFILSYWSDKYGITKLIENEEPSELSLLGPDRFSTTASNFVLKQLQSLNLQDATFVSRMVEEYYLKCNYLTAMAGAQASVVTHEWVQQFNRIHGNDAAQQRMNQLNTQITNLIEDMYGSNVRVTEYEDKKLEKRSIRSFQPVALYGSKWFPTGSEYFANLWRLYFYNKIEASAVRSLIKHYESIDGCMSKSGSWWHPANAFQLHMMHQILFVKYNICIISGYVNYFEIGKKGGVNVTVPFLYGYDQIPNEVRNTYNSRFHRNAMLASFETQKQWKLGNPVHRHQTQSKIIHSVETEFSRHALFWWLEKVVFIVNKNQVNSNNFWTKTIKITMGTLVAQLSESKFGLVTDVKSEKWSIEFEREDMNFEQFANYLDATLKKIQSKSERITNQLIHPIWEVQILPLQWKFSDCFDAKHDHFNYSDQELFLLIDSNCRTSKQIEENVIEQIQVNDEFRIGNLSINDGIVEFSDPNEHLPGYQSHFKYRWMWNFVIIIDVLTNEQNVCFTLLYEPLYDFLVVLNDPFFFLWPGCVRRPEKAPGNMTVCPYTFNADGYTISASENNVRTKESVKQHYISWNDHLLRNNIVSSLGVVIEDNRNDAFYTVMEADMLRCLFKGVVCDNNLRVFCIPFANCSDSKEIKVNTGIIGPLNDRNDYSTTFSKFESIATLKALHERHFAHNVSQLHLNKMRICAQTFIPYFVGVNWNLAKKNISHLDLSNDFIAKFQSKIRRSIETLKRKAGIALKGKPSLSFLPSINLAVPELMHNTIDGILGAIASVAIKSIKKIKKNDEMFKIYNQTFRKLAYSSGHRPSLIPSTHLFKGGGKGLKTSKAINTYISSFTLALVGNVLGVEPSILSTLRKMTNWLGLFHSPTLRGTNVTKLVDLCDEICERIEKNKELASFFWLKGRIRVWRNLNQTKLYWFAWADRFIGMIFDALNKLSKLRETKFKQQQKSELLTKHTLQQRAIKDFETLVLDREGPLGWGFIELFQSDDEFCWLLHKFLKYSLNDNGEFELNRNSDNQNCSYNSKFIKLMQVSNISSNIWINICNKLEETNEINETKQMTRMKIPLFWNNMDYILKHLFEWKSEEEFDNIRNNFIIGLQDGTIEVSNCKGMSLFYREWCDCNVRCTKSRQDIVWMKYLDKNKTDNVAQLLAIFNITGICQNNLLSQSIKENCSPTPDNCILCLGYSWIPIVASDCLNYEQYDFESTPLVRPTSEICAFDGTDIVMKMYCVHDHLIPSKHNLKWMANVIPNFPRLSDTYFPDTNEWIIHPPELVKYWCGFGIRCMCDLNQVNCEMCHCRPGKIVISCLESEWPVFRLYGIYQGWICRYCTTRGVSE